MLTKRIIDLSLGVVALILFLPVLAVCAVIIRLSSNGSFIYKQVRAGKDGKLFEMYKLRTMVDDAESKTGPVWASDNDPRVMPVCKWMRRSHLDELPQLINVIKGEMSLIGPRPERPEIIQSLKKQYPNIDRRLNVLPGITGLAQIRNGYDKTIDSVKRKLDFDLEYINSRKLSMEVMILLATLPKFYDKAAN